MNIFTLFSATLQMTESQFPPNSNLKISPSVRASSSLFKSKSLHILQYLCSMYVCTSACYTHQQLSCFLRKWHVCAVVFTCVTDDSQALLSVTKCLTALKPLTWKYTGHTAVGRQPAWQLLSDLHQQILCKSNMMCNTVVLYS